MSERTFFRGHIASRISAVDHVIKGGQIVDHSIRNVTKYDEKPNKTRSISTVLIKIKTEGFMSSEKGRLDLLNWSFGFHPKISFAFSINLCCFITYHEINTFIFF